MNMDYTIDYETSLNTVDKTPFVETKFKSEDKLGEAIPIKPDEVVNSNPLLDVSEPILPIKKNDVVMSKADVPIYDLLMTNEKVIKDYASMTKEYYVKSMKEYLDFVKGKLGDVKIGDFFKDNVKITALLIGIASVMFAFNNILTLGIVGIVFFMTLKNVKNIF